MKRTKSMLSIITLASAVAMLLALGCSSTSSATPGSTGSGICGTSCVTEDFIDGGSGPTSCTCQGGSQAGAPCDAGETACKTLCCE